MFMIGYREKGVDKEDLANEIRRRVGCNMAPVRQCRMLSRAHCTVPTSQLNFLTAKNGANGVVLI